MDATRTPSAIQLAHVAADRWERVQVELQGKYSTERMRAFHAYSNQTSWYRILFWCMVTPIPCLVINILLDIAPLAPPSAGRDANYVFWARFATFDVIMTYWSLAQIGYWTPALGMKPWHALTTSIAVTVTNTAFLYIVAGLIEMPVPFVLLTTAPVASVPTMAMFAIYFGRKLKNDTTLRASFNRSLNINSLQLYLMFVYPAFIYGFNSIPSEYQTVYMIFVPVIKIIAKNIVSRLTGSNDDMKPVEIIFNIDCFNAIYVSLVMQRATTISTSLTVMLIDIAQACVSVYDVYQSYQPLKKFMSKLPIHHPLYGKNFLEVAMALDREGVIVSRAKQPSNMMLTNPALETESAKPLNLSTTMLRASSAKVFIATHEHSSRHLSGDTSMQQELCSSESRTTFLHATRKLLFTTEFVVLVEYTEVIMPVFYSLIMTASYHLPNRAFYSTIGGIDEHKLWSMITSVLMYAALELLSLLAMDLVLRRIIGISALRQVGFVLDSQRVLVQSKLLSWVFYAVQNSLGHFGADFSFKFKWLHSH